MGRHVSSEPLYVQQVRRAVHTQSVIQFRFDTDLLLPYKIDEVSLLWSTLAQLRDFASWANDNGADVFNAHVVDHMHRLDQPGDFDVSFEFLRVPPHPWRIEAMCAGNGHSPLHTRQLQQFSPGCVMHASFKCEDRDAYKAAGEALAGAGLAPAAAYQNGYGLFSYWGPIGNVWVKPRVNLRDAPDG